MFERSETKLRVLNLYSGHLQKTGNPTKYSFDIYTSNHLSFEGVYYKNML